MNYYLNISNGLDKEFRLQRDNSWKYCEDPSVISKTDFVTNNPNLIRKLQVSDQQITIDSENYIIQPELGLSMDDNELFYSVYLFRQEYPSPPSIVQLRQTLLEGNDNKDNTLILKVDGLFHLYSPLQLSNTVDPEIVLQHKRMNRGNGYVGSKLSTLSDFDSYVEVIFKISIYYWKEHLDKKEVHFYPEESFDSDPEEIVDLFCLLNDIKKNWN